MKSSLQAVKGSCYLQPLALDTNTCAGAYWLRCVAAFTWHRCEGDNSRGRAFQSPSQCLGFQWSDIYIDASNCYGGWGLGHVCLQLLQGETFSRALLLCPISNVEKESAQTIMAWTFHQLFSRSDIYVFSKRCNARPGLCVQSGNSASLQFRYRCMLR